MIINDGFGLETQLDPKNNGIAVNAENASKALELHAMAHPNDRLVGWYRTGLQIEANSTSIHDRIIIKKLSILSNKISKKAGPELAASEYVHLLVDTALKNDKLTIKAYTTISINDPIQEQEYSEYLKEKKRRERAAKNKKNNPNSSTSKASKSRKKRRKKAQNNTENNDESTASSTQQTTPSESPQKAEKGTVNLDEPLKEIEKPFPIFYRFKEITTTYSASESEKIGLDMIIESPPEGTSLDSPSMLMNDTNHLETVLQSLLGNIESVEDYVHQVINGQIEGDQCLGWLIGDALSSVPNLSPQKFEQMLSNQLQDFLMMVYLGKMTKAQLVIADKINKVLPSTVPGYEPDNKE